MRRIPVYYTLVFEICQVFFEKISEKNNFFRVYFAISAFLLIFNKNRRSHLFLPTKLITGLDKYFKI